MMKELRKSRVMIGMDSEIRSRQILQCLLNVFVCMTYYLLSGDNFGKNEFLFLSVQMRVQKHLVFTISWCEMNLVKRRERVPISLSSEFLRLGLPTHQRIFFVRHKIQKLRLLNWYQLLSTRTADKLYGAPEVVNEFCFSRICQIAKVNNTGMLICCLSVAT